MLLFLLLCSETVALKEPNPAIAMPYRIQGTVIFPNGTSVYADHELPSDPGRVDQMLLFRGLFQLAGKTPMGPIRLGDSQDKNDIRGTVLFPNGQRHRAYRKLLPFSEGNQLEEHDELYLRNGSLGAHVFTISERDRTGENGGQVKVKMESSNPSQQGGNAYYLEKERLGAFVYSDASDQDSRLASYQSIVSQSCRFNLSLPRGQRGQFWLLRSKPCGSLPRLTTTLPDGTNIHFYGVPVLVDL